MATRRDQAVGMIRKLRTTATVVVAAMWMIKNPESAAQFVQQFCHALATLVGTGSG
jgi:hypothetical protein